MNAKVASMDVVDEYQALVDRLPKPTLEERIQIDLLTKALITGSGKGQPKGIIVADDDHDLDQAQDQ